MQDSQDLIAPSLSSGAFTLEGLLSLSVVKKRSVSEIFKEAWQLYQKRGWAYTHLLWMPLGLLFVGAYIALWGSISFMDYTIREKISDSTFLVGGVLLFLSFGIFMHVRGFWSYLVYFVSLNINVVQDLQALETAESLSSGGGFKAAYAVITRRANGYILLLLALTVIWFCPNILGFILSWISSWFIPEGSPLYWVSQVVNLLLGLLVSLLVTIFSIYICFSFQVFALENTPISPIHALKRSIQLVRGNFWRVTFIITLLGIVTNGLVPMLVGLFMEGTQLAALISSVAMENVVKAILEAFFYLGKGSVAVEVFKLLEKQMLLLNPDFSLVKELSRACVEILFQSFAVSLLLPLGTFVFTVLYLDLLARSTPLALSSEV
jgi:hypothetical protein